jgi:S1-C subfamily serine protease
VAITSVTHAAGPFGTIHIAGCSGGAYTDDSTGALSHCAAGADDASEVSLVVSAIANNSWLLGSGSNAFHFNKGDPLPVVVTVDGQSEARLFATVNSPILVSAMLPSNIARTFQKSSLMVAVAGSTPLQFNLTSTAALANCVAKVKAEGINNVGDFAAPRAVPARPDTPNGAPGKSKSGRTDSQSGLFVISANGHMLTNHHVVDGCTGDIHGNLSGEPATTLRVVSKRRVERPRVAAGAGGLVQELREDPRSLDRSGASVVAIGYPYHGLCHRTSRSPRVS